MPLNEKTNVLVRNPTWFDKNQAVQLKKMARCLKFRIHKIEELYYTCSENEGADLRLCFRICNCMKPTLQGGYGPSLNTFNTYKCLSRYGLLETFHAQIHFEDFLVFDL